jgi:hypothetical protein
VPSGVDIPASTRGEGLIDPLPSVVLDPELEAQSERRSSRPAAPVATRVVGGDDAETALIPRALLDGPDAHVRSSEVRAHRQAWLGLVTIGVVATALVVLAAYLKPRPDSVSAAQPSAVAVPAVAAAAEPAPPAVVPGPRIRVESEPTGAHVVYQGAVVGTTPTEVPLPQGEMLYLLRLPGHQSQLLQLSPTSDARIVVAMRPDQAPAAPASPARATKAGRIAAR